MVSSADLLQTLQSSFAHSHTFASLRKNQPKRPSKLDSHAFRIGHGGTLDPLAAGVLIVGIGRGTKHLQQYLACSKTYETIVIFGGSTDTYDCTGNMTARANAHHVTQGLVEEKLDLFRGTIQQAPPIYSALKINGIKACEYARQGKALPRNLESREMQVDECTLMEWYAPGQHSFSWPGEYLPSHVPAARIKLVVCSGFYVRSFAHDLGIACGTYSHMVSLLRTQQANFTISEPPGEPGLVSAITYADIEAGEDVWGAKLRPQLEDWVELHPLNLQHINGRDQDTKLNLAAERKKRPRQRFRGEWEATTKQERIKQQGGKFKGKWSRIQGERPNLISQSTQQTQQIS